jgi:hypothetical protein
MMCDGLIIMTPHDDDTRAVRISHCVVHPGLYGYWS